MVFEQMIYGSCNFVSGSDWSKLRAALSAFASIERAKRAGDTRDGSGRLTKSLSCSIIGRQRSRFQNFSSRNIIVRSQTTPGRKMLFSRPAAHICTDFREDGLSQR